MVERATAADGIDRTYHSCVVAVHRSVGNRATHMEDGASVSKAATSLTKKRRLPRDTASNVDNH